MQATLMVAHNYATPAGCRAANSPVKHRNGHCWVIIDLPNHDSFWMTCSATITYLANPKFHLQMIAMCNGMKIMSKEQVAL